MGEGPNAVRLRNSDHNAPYYISTPAEALDKTPGICRVPWCTKLEAVCPVPELSDVRRGRQDQNGAIRTGEASDSRTIPIRSNSVSTQARILPQDSGQCARFPVPLLLT